MQFKIKRFSALMMAVMMLLGVTGAFAMDMRPDRRTQVLLDGKNISTQMQLQVDQATLLSMLSMFGIVGQSGEGDQANGQQAVINTLLGALNKLKITALQNSTDSYVTVGTEKGDLLDLQVSADPTSGEASMTTSLMPEVKISMPADMMGLGSYQTILQSHNMQKITDWLAPYQKALDVFGEKYLNVKMKTETGVFDFADEGSFDYKASLEIDTHLAAAFLQEMLPQIKDDKVIQDHLALASSSQIAGTNDMGDSLQKYQEFISSLEEGIVQMNSEANQVIVKLDIYSNTQMPDTMYLQAEIMDAEIAMAFVTFSAKQAEGGNQMRLSLLTRAEEQTEDWASLRAGILAGTNSQGVLADMTVIEQKNEADNKHMVNSKINLYLMGLNVGFTIDNSGSLMGVYESQTNVAMNIFSPLPLISFLVSESETEQALPQAETQGFKELVVSDNMSEEESVLLGEKLMTGVSVLLEKLYIAMPEEAPMLMMLINSATSGMTEYEDSQDVQSQGEEPQTEILATPMPLQTVTP